MCIPHFQILPEREKRLAEIGEEDSSKLWDFFCGICSGRIKEPERTNGGVNTMGEKTVTSYEDFIKALRCGENNMLCKFRRNNPERYAYYVEQMGAGFGCKNSSKTRDIKGLEEEQEKRSEILAIPDIRARHKAIAENMELFGR
jgi:hypothetical protein